MCNKNYKISMKIIKGLKCISVGFVLKNVESAYSNKTLNAFLLDPFEFSSYMYVQSTYRSPRLPAVRPVPCTSPGATILHELVVERPLVLFGVPLKREGSDAHGIALPDTRIRERR